ncbi:inorganic phosphate transporter [Epibacterium ulvae]|uniref:inorganic phosphate transporter n=1 Tax=Epibacterium ulvae TaxID=1156985 RepID=UPI0024922AED|nr:inorganic phosphate transporter [Epibacterium ulvae]
MSDMPEPVDWKTLDKDLKRISQLELATAYVSRPLIATGMALAFVVLAALVASVFLGTESHPILIIAATGFGAYMALNIGANDVANNMGPAVGARALTLGGALLIAAIAESTGALLAGDAVVKRIATDILLPGSVSDSTTFVWAMMAALMAAALWVNLSTWIGAPVSTTHSVVGGVLGAGLFAAGIAAVNWKIVGLIGLSWVISPILAGIIAAAFLAFIKVQILYQTDRIAAAQRWLPALVAVMAGVFITYLIHKGLGRLIEVPLTAILPFGLGTGTLTFFIVKPVIHRQSRGLDNKNKSLKALFSLPLILSATLLSFAHGANDVANAIGPVAAIVQTLQTGAISADAPVPAWVMIVGGFGISFGLFLFGPKLIRMVGSQITKLNPMRAFCVSLATAFTVIVASALGLPVSSTHTAVGAVFGVGFFREWFQDKRRRKKGKASAFEHIAAEERRRRKLVRRSHFMTILAAWIVTVPASALISALIYALLRWISG